MITMTYLLDKRDVAPFVGDVLRALSYDCLSITTTSQERLEGFFVRIVTDTSSVGTVESLARSFSAERMNI